jgi:hypothetical protein
MQNNFSELKMDPIRIRTKKSIKVNLWVTGQTKPRTIHITGMTIPQIQRTFAVGSDYGFAKKIEALTIG